MSSSSSSSSSSNDGSSCATPAEPAMSATAAGGGGGAGGSSGGSGGGGASGARDNRFEYLLKQTELFSHFMGGGAKAKSPLKVKQPSSKPSKSSAREGDHRHRMTEQEEDEELLTDLNQSKKSVINFDESPHYIKSGKLRGLPGARPKLDDRPV
jgi:hypothetical protein